MNELLLEQGYCPYCGERIELLVDRSEPSQSYIEDCQVCCRPIVVAIEVDPDGQVMLQLRHENEC